MRKTMVRLRNWLAAPALLVAALAGGALPAAAQDSGNLETIGKSENWQLGLQEAATPVMEQVHAFHDLLMVIITAITIFVLVLLLYVAYRFSEKRNPTPSKTSHNTLLEIAWTAIPVIILVVIAIPSFKLLYYEDQIVDSEMTVKAIGRQWYWSYAYPDHGDFEFDSFMKRADELDENDYRQLSVDNPLVLPVDTNIRIQITSSDVLHSFAMPSFGIKTDAVPGQLNETWARIQEPGIYYGQCSEICGSGHADMPIAVHALPKDEFQAWVESEQAKRGIDTDKQLAEAGQAQ
jgi:cytochrome c oxidase subunit 2